MRSGESRFKSEGKNRTETGTKLADDAERKLGAERAAGQGLTLFGIPHAVEREGARDPL